MNKEKIIHDTKLAICREMFKLTEYYPDFDITITINFEKPATLDNAWFISREGITGEMIAAHSISIVGSE